MPTAAPDLATCNLALAQVPNAPIASIDENSQGAVECKRAYPQVLGELLEMYPWRFARKRQSLAIVTNDRPMEWQTAFAMPSDIAQVVSIQPDYGVTPAGTLTLLAGQRLAVTVFDGVVPTIVPLLPVDGYMIAAGVLYANMLSAVLEYTSTAVDSGRFPAGFRNALAMGIAARVVMPITKSRERQGDLLKAARTAWEHAVTDDANQAPARALDFVPRDTAARTGWVF